MALFYLDLPEGSEIKSFWQPRELPLAIMSDELSTLGNIQNCQELDMLIEKFREFPPFLVPIFTLLMTARVRCFQTSNRPQTLLVLPLTCEGDVEQL